MLQFYSREGLTDVYHFKKKSSVFVAWCVFFFLDMIGRSPRCDSGLKFRTFPQFVFGVRNVLGVFFSMRSKNSVKNAALPGISWNVWGVNRSSLGHIDVQRPWGVRQGIPTLNDPSRMKCTSLGAREKHKPEKLRFCFIMFYRYEPGSKLVALGMAIPPLIGNPYNGYINPYYWVDDHPLLYGNNRILDPSTYEPPMFFISTLRIFSLWESCHLLSLQVNFG